MTSADRNSKACIPQGSRHDAREDTDLDLPDLPGDWEWRTANMTFNHKVNLYFGIDVSKTGGHLGEIDNWVDDGEEQWTLHVRPIVDIPESNENRPRATAETSEEYTSLEDAIEAVPAHIATHYGADRLEEGGDVA